GWYVFTSTDSVCNFTHTDSMLITIDHCQDSVWPGDINQDHIVNYKDILYFAVHRGYRGVPRKNASLNYTGQACPDWAINTQNVNQKHADCDGNGIVNFADTVAINQHYGLTHPKEAFVPRPKIASVPDLYFDTTGL